MDKAIKRYKMITGRDEDEVSQSVNAYISEGWQPYGAPYAIINRFGDCILVQVVVKYDSL